MANTITQDEINAVAWKACDTFRGVVDPSEYKNYILVFLFIKYLSDVWKDKLEYYQNKYPDDEERVKRKMERESFILPKGSTFDEIYRQRDNPDIGNEINKALERIEESNKVMLEGVFRNMLFLWALRGRKALRPYTHSSALSVSLRFKNSVLMAHE